MSNMTTFKSDYVVHEVKRRPPEVTKVFVSPDGRMRHTSTYARDYPIHSVQQKIITSVSDEYHPPTSKMAAQSEYTGNVSESVWELAFSLVHIVAEPWTREIGEPLRSSSTMKENYQAWGTPMGFADRLKRP
ncbi:hypothetical protein DPEC_G00147070 [Dallia pectoralis]|uniref:Uncharacterized protein n=1 Tax=Dallia pectoralis TaxID=75939 RepID=A0ACC2GI74_DALPE|nr:hypothetical protein DPEC_G00147070 [Dallia pectoralis]